MKRLIVAFLIGAAPVAALAQGQPAAQGRIATEVFAQLPFMRNPQLSPNGKMIVMQLGHDGTNHMALIDLSVPNSKPTLMMSSDEFKEVGDRTVAGWRWVGNDNVVITLASREDVFGTRADLTRLFAYNIRTRKMTPLAWEGAMASASRILHIDHDKSTILLERTSNRNGSERWDNPEVVEVDVNTGDFEVDTRSNAIIGSWYADGDGVVRAGTGYDRDSGKVQVIYRSNEDSNFDTIFNRADKDFSGGEIIPSIFLPDPDMAIVTSNTDGFQKVYKVNLKDMQFDKPVFQSKGYDVEGVIANKDNNALVGVGVIEEGLRFHWVEPRRAQIQQFLDESFGVGNAELVSSDLDETRFIVHVGAPNQAGGYYLYDVESGDFGRLGWRDNILQDKKLNPVSTITYRASDGEMIPAVLTMPRHRTTKKDLPLVILTHGGPFGVRDQEDYDDWAQAIAELGYVVVQPNYRGSGGYGKDWLKKGRNDGFGLRMQDDLNDAITHLAAKGIVDPKRVCMMGWSYGGYASARAAQRDADKYRCTIAGAGVYDLVMMKRYDATYLGSFGANYLAKGAADLDTVSPAKHTDGDWAPIMIVHGVRDSRVPIDQARTLVSRLKSSGKRQGVDFDYVEQPKNTHNLPYNDVREEWLKAAERWLAQHNPAFIESDPDKPVPVAVTLGG